MATVARSRKSSWKLLAMVRSSHAPAIAAASPQAATTISVSLCATTPSARSFSHSALSVSGTDEMTMSAIEATSSRGSAR